MKTIFDSAERASIEARLARLEAGATHLWGKMDVAQMLCHAAIALEAASGDRPMPQKWIGKILAPLVKKSVLGEKPFSHGSPTDPTFVVKDVRDFVAERERVRRLLGRFCERGPAEAAKQVHVFFGKLSGAEWGVLMYKHLDHHLRQFGG